MEEKKHVYSVAKLKTFMGHDGDPKGGFQCDVLKDGKKIGTCVNDSWGGGYVYRFNNKQDEIDLLTYCESLPKTKPFPDIKGYENTEMDVDIDCFVDELVNDFDWMKHIKRKCRKNTLVTFEGDKPDTYRTFKIEFSEKVKNAILEKYPNTTKFWNEAIR